MSTFSEIFDDFRAYPSGDAQAWLEHYEVLIDEVRRYKPLSSPKISVVVLGWRQQEPLLLALDHIRQQRGFGPQDCEIILVDNGGLQAIYPQLQTRLNTHVIMRGNVGPSVGRNIGFALASTPVVFSVDDDGLIAPDYCERALRYFEDPRVVAIRARITHRAHPYFTTLASHYDRGPRPVGDCLITEGAMALRRDAFISAGGFAEQLYGHEGIDLSFRLKRQDPTAKIIYAPDVVMAHDYMHDWSKFIRKNLTYRGINQSVAARDEELAVFMKDYFAQRFDHRKRGVDEEAARLTLMGLRAALRFAAKQRAKR